MQAHRGVTDVESPVRTLRYPRTVRVVLISMLVMLAAPVAQACPIGTVCVSAETRGGGEISRTEIARPRSLLQLAIKRAELRSPDHLATSLRTHITSRDGAIEMPWIWQVLRRSVYARMPRYERTSRRPESRFSFVVSPVVVESPQDTVPGVGLEGGF